MNAQIMSKVTFFPAADQESGAGDGLDESVEVLGNAYSE